MQANSNPVPEYLADAASRPHWERIGVRRRVGVCVPLASLRSRRGCGVGDAADLIALVDWCRSVGLSVIQILPINDMGLDCVPYAAISAFAIDPLYLALDRVPCVADDPELAVRLRAESDRLNALDRSDIRAARDAKLAILADALARPAGRALDADLADFRRRNPWLEDYLPFRVIKEAESFRSWEDWGPRYADPQVLAAFLADHDDRVRLHLAAQMLLDRQLQEARAYSSANGVLLKGDIPILVGRDSADVWRLPGIFDLGTSAGAPPDMYSADGQNWGPPTYRWDVLHATDCAWWRARLRHAQRHFDLYRIDHVVGFFRIWTIPAGKQGGKEGAFVPADEAVWGEHGRRILSMMLDASTMLPLAEDLGTIPDICRETLRDLGICGMKVQRWERRWNSDRGYILPGDYPPTSLVTLSTHDSETFAHWWEACPEDRDLLWTTLGHELPAPATATPEVGKEVVRWLGGTSALFVIHLLQDLLAPFGLLKGEPADQRINLPGTVNDTNWRWRCPVALEDLVADRPLADGVREMLGFES